MVFKYLLLYKYVLFIKACIGFQYNKYNNHNQNVYIYTEYFKQKITSIYLVFKL